MNRCAWVVLPVSECGERGMRRRVTIGEDVVFICSNVSRRTRRVMTSSTVMILMMMVVAVVVDVGLGI